MLYAAIDHVKYNALGRVGIGSFAPFGGADAESGIDTTNFDNERAQIFSTGTLGAIQYVVEGLRELPGRKSVVLSSENLKLMYGGEQSQRVQDSIRLLGDAANRASVVIHSIDPRGLVTTGLTAADNTRGMTPARISQVPMQRSQEMFDSQDDMVILAHETGGLFMRNTADSDGVPQQEEPKRLIGGGRMQLGGKMTAGDYVLQAIVTDKLAKEKYRVATQAMDFEIQAAPPPQQ